MVSLETVTDILDSGNHPLEWPPSETWPLSRRAVARIVLTACADQGLLLGWETPIADDDLRTTLGEAITEDLGIWVESDPTAPTIGALVVEAEGLCRSYWPPFVAVTDPETDALAALLRASTVPGVSATSPLETAIPPQHLETLWQRLAPPWMLYLPGAPVRTAWWPLAPESVTAIALFLLIAAWLLAWSTERLGVRGIFVFVAFIVCRAVVLRFQPFRVFWPRDLATVTDLANRMAQGFRAEQERLKTWEK